MRNNKKKGKKNFAEAFPKRLLQKLFFAVKAAIAEAILDTDYI